MKTFLRLLMCLSLLLLTHTHNEAQIELRQSASSTFNVIDASKTNINVQPDINLTRQLFIEGYYHDFTGGKLGAVFLVNISTPDGSVKVQYPVAVMLAGEGRQEPIRFPIYGPWFYQGEKELNVNLTMVLLKSERAAELRTKFQNLLGGATGLLSVIPGAASVMPFINTGSGIAVKAWDLYDEVTSAAKDEKVPFKTLTISRLPLGAPTSAAEQKKLESGEAIGTFQRWIVLTPAKFEPLYNNGPYSSTAVGAESRPVIPVNKDARVLLVRVKQEPPTTSMAFLGNRLAAFLGSQQTRLDKAKVEVHNPFSGDNIAAQTHVQRTFNGLVAFTSAAAEKGGLTNREAVLWLFKELLNGQNSGSNDTSYVRLKPVDEARVTAALSRMFKYQKTSTDTAFEDNEGTQSLSKIVAWNNWLNKRDKAQAIVWEPAREVAPFATVTGNYALSRAATYLPSVSTNTTNAPNYNDMGDQLNALRQGLLTIFRPTSGEPFMLFEQQAVADWMRSSFSNLGIDIPTNFKSSDEVADFASKLDKQLGGKKVMIYDAAQKSVEFKDIVPYVRQQFNKQVAQIGLAQTTDQTAKMREIVNVYVIPARRAMSADEQAELDKALGANLVDNVTGATIGTLGYSRFFDDNLFSLNTDGSIMATDADKNLTKAIRYWRGVYQSPDSIPKTASKALLSPEPLIDFMDTYLQQTGRPMSHYQRVISFVKASAPSLNDLQLPTEASQMQSWDDAAANRLSTFAYIQGPGEFGDNQPPEIRSINKIDFNFSEAKRLGVLTPQGGVDDLRKLARYFADTSANSTRIQAAAKKVLQSYVTLPANQNGGNNPYLNFVDKWDPRWHEGSWTSGLLLDVNDYAARLRVAAEKNVEPQQGRLILENLIGWFSNVNDLAEGARIAVGDVLQQFVEPPAGIPALTPQAYVTFLRTQNPQWVSGKWRASK